jgi:NAD+ kinase
MKIERALVVYRKSLYQIYVQEHHDRAVRHALRSHDAGAEGLRHGHETQAAALASIERTLRRSRVEAVCRWRAHMRSTRTFDLVISLGGDGTLLDTSHRILDATPLLGINSDPGRSVGALCAGYVDDLADLLDRLQSGTLRPRAVTRIRIRVDGQEMLGPTLNDVLLAHSCPAGLSRFDLAELPAQRTSTAHSGHDGTAFRAIRGSGIWVSTPIGSTAAIHSAGGQIMPLGSARLQFLIREPYLIPGASTTSALRGYVPPGRALVLVSRIRQGALWADGAHRHVALDYSQQVILDQHPVPLQLVIPRR